MKENWLLEGVRRGRGMRVIGGSRHSGSGIVTACWGFFRAVKAWRRGSREGMGVGFACSHGIVAVVWCVVGQTALSGIVYPPCCAATGFFSESRNG